MSGKSVSGKSGAKDLSNRVQLRTREVADVAGVSLSQAKVWLKTEAVPSYLIDNMRFVWKEDLLAFIQRHRETSTGLAA